MRLGFADRRGTSGHRVLLKMMAVQFESGQGTALGELPLEFAEIL